MRKTVLVLATSTFFTLCSGISLAYAGTDDDMGSTSTTVVATTNDHSGETQSSGSSFSSTDSQAVPSSVESTHDEDLVVDEETDLHRELSVPAPSQSEVKAPSAPVQPVFEPKTQEDYWKCKLQLLVERNKIEQERNHHLAVLAQNSTMTALLEATKKKEADDEKKKAQEAEAKMKAPTDATRSMFS